MIDVKDVNTILQEWLNNPSWKEYYDEAPSDRCKSFIALEFYYSDTEDDTADDEARLVSNSLGGLGELRHIYRLGVLACELLAECYVEEHDADNE